MASEAQIAANRANARKSTGPKTAEGKAKVALNGLTHGMCARQAVLPYEDRQGYEDLRAELIGLWRPADRMELFLVEEIAGCTWRLRRAPQSEAGILSAHWPLKLQQAQDRRPDRDLYGLAMDSVGLGVAFARAAKALASLSLHESRVARRRERAIALLEARQAARRAREARELALDSRQAAAGAPAPATSESGAEAQADRELALDSQQAGAAAPVPAAPEGGADPQAERELALDSQIGATAAAPRAAPSPVRNRETIRGLDAELALLLREAA